MAALVVVFDGVGGLWVGGLGEPPGGGKGGKGEGGGPTFGPRAQAGHEP